MTTATSTRREDLFFSYDVADGFHHNVKGKSAAAIWKDIEAKVDKALLGRLEYVSAGKDDFYDVGCRRVIVYTAKGDSEGYYLHVDMVSRDGKLKNLILAKTLGAAAFIKELERQIWEIVDRE